HFEGNSWHGWERNRHLRNRGDGTFEEIGTPAGSDLLLNSRGIAAADFWNRGVLDLAVAASTDRAALLRNELAGRRHYLAVELTGAGRDQPDGTNRDAVGARVTVSAGGMAQVREVTLGDGYGSQNALRLHFGLGDATVVDSLTVHWPRSGLTQSFHNIPADRIVTLTEGANELGKLGPDEPLDLRTMR
ncbi:MAG TPA: CRTAC1 family protein, partial [Thermoanaerobaculia bacterium]|nr:CRTAC1 family protein [Thermoanaerobaculia bacterium]